MQTPPGMSPLYPHKQTLPRATSSALACSSLSGSQRHPESRSYRQQSAGASHHGKKNLSQTKIALHRTRLRFLDHKNFSVLFFFKPDRQTAPVLAALRKTETEKIEKNFSIFHFQGSA
ncbi:hypothetical protein [Enterobacter roggenkampii]|uniref:hypothetical protein n=1 Tax=Enterobacter roggenkampii TaxID=1812935 RepID=UPI002A81D79B|nr:hypothetical protein [Enterobacter roggenkampii]